MLISYKPLWKKLIDMDINKTQLRSITGVSSSTISKLTKNEIVSLEVLVRICGELDCQLSDVCELTKD